jgi:hypothetical protein
MSKQYNMSKQSGNEWPGPVPGAERGTPPYGHFETINLMEPHKMFQNSVTIFQKRGGPYGRYDEPIHTKFP